MNAEIIETEHPLGKRNKPVDKGSYELFKATILSVLRDLEPTHSELEREVARRLAKSFDGNISWHVMTVKLDLEARRLVERLGSEPERYRLAPPRARR